VSLALVAFAGTRQSSRTPTTQATVSPPPMPPPAAASEPESLARLPPSPPPQPSRPAPAAVEPAHVDALRRDLASDSAAIRIAAIEAAVDATAIDTLPVLEQVDLARDPQAAPTVIHAVAKLGAAADDATRDHAARTLSSWLRTERSREGLDALGNVSNLVEALGNIGGPDAASALAAALDRADLGLHVETLATMKLGELGDHRARGAVERFAARTAALPETDGLSEELRVEAVAAARSTLATL
jgi:hypothetical protein